MLWLTNLENDQIFGIFKFETLTNFKNITVLQTKPFVLFYHLENQYLKFEKLLNILSIQITIE